MLVVLGLCGCAHSQPRAFSFAQLCDPQIGFSDYEQDLARLEAAIAKLNELPIDFVVVCGDLVNTADDRSLRDFNSAKEKLRVPVHCAPGNHDLGNAPSAASLKSFRDKVGPDFYSFDHRGFRFIILNTQLWKTNIVGETDRQEEWLTRTLLTATKTSRPVVVVGHYPPFVNTPDEADAYFNLPQPVRARWLPKMQSAGVKAILAGHTHTANSRYVEGMQVVTGETTSKNFDARPFGFRLWQADVDGTLRHRFIPLPDAFQSATNSTGAR